MEAKDVGVGNCQECGAELSAPGLSRSLAHSVPPQKTIREVSLWATLKQRPPKVSGGRGQNRSARELQRANAGFGPFALGLLSSCPAAFGSYS